MNEKIKTWQERRTEGNSMEAAMLAEVAELRAALDRPSEAGTPSARLAWMLDELAKRFPDAHKPFSADPPELRFMAAIDAALAAALTRIADLNLKAADLEFDRSSGVQEKYDELIFAVGKKYPSETRHETALRYIQQAERGSDEQARAGMNHHSD
jgi:hypothetical protein